MKKFGRKLIGAFFDLRVIVALSGILLSVAAHELFHIILHWGEIKGIHILPGNDAIVEILFTSSVNYDTAAEELFAYSISTSTLLLTAMLVNDIHEVKNATTDTRSALEVVSGAHYFGDEDIATQRLATILRTN